MDDFNPEEWVAMSVKDRVRTCMLMARSKRKLAEIVGPVLKDDYLILATHLDELAAEVEKAA